MAIRRWNETGTPSRAEESVIRGATTGSAIRLRAGDVAAECTLNGHTGGNGDYDREQKESPLRMGRPDHPAQPE